jgi:hypothetical protein
MKARRLKALGFALLGSLALLFAGCGQQAGGGQPGGGQEPPKPIQVSITGVTPGQVVAGAITGISVSINEDSQVQEVALFVNDTLVAKYNIAAQGIRPQALRYDFTVNTAACDRTFLTSSTGTGCSVTRNTPLFPNGTYQIRAVVKNPVETKTISVPVVLDNKDLIAFTISGNSAQDADGRTWYGNGDVTVRGVIVNYTGATYTFQRVNATTWKINRTGGQAVNTANFLPSGNQSISGATLSSASGTDLVFAKRDNEITTPVTGAMYYSATVLDPYLLQTQPILRIDNEAPAAPTLQVQRLYEETPVNATPSIPVSRSTKLFYSGASDPGPGVGTDPASFQATLEFGIPTQTVTKGRGDSLNDLPTGTYTITVKKLVIKDRLGNTTEVTTGLPTLNFNTTPASISFASPPAATATAGAGYTINLSYTATDFAVVALALKQGGNRYLFQSLTPGPNTWTAFKLGDGPSAAMELAVVAVDRHGNVRELPLNITVSAASATDQQAPAVNSLTATSGLKAGVPSPTATLSAKASERPSHSASAVFFISFFRQHSNAGQYFVPVSVGPVTGGSSEDTADSDPASPISGSTYPNPGTFGTAVLVRDGAHNAALGTGTLTVNP